MIRAFDDVREHLFRIGVVESHWVTGLALAGSCGAPRSR